MVIEVADSTLELTVKAILERAGHSFGPAPGAVYITDEVPRAASLCAKHPVVLLTTAANAEAAVAAMKLGVYGYALLPLIPGEIELLVSRAAGTSAAPADEEPLQPLAEVEMRHIRNTLRRCNNNQAKAARVLGIGRNTLWRKLRRDAAENAGEGEAAAGNG